MKTLKTRADFFRDHPGMVVAELGVFMGDFSRELLPYTSHLFMVDLWKGSETSGDKDGLNIKTVNNMEGLYYDLLGEFDRPDVTLVRRNSVEWLAGLEDDCLDCVYLDTSHGYSQVTHELNISFDKVRAGGWITGHDFNINGVNAAVQQFCRSRELDVDYTTEDGFPSYFIQNIK